MILGCVVRALVELEVVRADSEFSIEVGGLINDGICDTALLRLQQPRWMDDQMIR